MGTRSRIGIELPDNRVVSVYCHWDGYPDYNGKILVEHYQNREDVEDLINGGGMSSLRTRETWGLNSAIRDEKGNQLHDSEGYPRYKKDRDPQPLYYSERGEEVEVRLTTFDEFASGELGGEEYAYLYDQNGIWQAYKTERECAPERVKIPDYVTA